MDTKRLFELAGCDVTTGKAKELVENFGKMNADQAQTEILKNLQVIAKLTKRNEQLQKIVEKAD